MLSLNRTTKFCAAILMTAVMLTGASSRSYADTGSVRLKVTKVGFIVGVGGGSGILHFKGKNYRLSVGGVGVGTIGAAGMDLVGPPPIFGPQRTSQVPIRPCLLGLQWRAAQKQQRYRTRTASFCNCRDDKSVLRLLSA